VREGLHHTGKAEHKQQPVFNLLTGAVTVDDKPDVPIQSMSIFILVLEKFRHVVVTRDHLSESELHALVTWTYTQFAMNKKMLVVERTVKAILLEMDQNHGQDLVKLIRSEARNMLADQQEIYDSSFPRTAPTETDKAATGARAETLKAKKAAAAAAKKNAADTSDIALEVPNNVSCWYWTNDLQCPNKFKDASGNCKYSALHGTCGMLLPDGKPCTGKHKATEHP
jgi:hypothetical protein